MGAGDNSTPLRFAVSREGGGQHGAFGRHQMETVSALLAICAGNSPVTGEFPTQRPVARSFEIFFGLCTNKRLSKQWWGWWLNTSSCPLWRHRNGGSSDLDTGICPWARRMMISHTQTWEIYRWKLICQVSTISGVPCKVVIVDVYTILVAMKKNLYILASDSVLIIASAMALHRLLSGFFVSYFSCTNIYK